MNLARTLATERKLEPIGHAHAAGLREIEAGSFVQVAGWLDGESLHCSLARAGLPQTMAGA